jgi:hypothetical protein
VGQENPVLLNCSCPVYNQVNLTSFHPLSEFLFFIFLFSAIPVYIQTQEPSDFAELSQIHMLRPDFTICEQDFQTIPNGSMVILDDFSFKSANKTSTKTDFLRVINYYLRHHSITLLLIVHNMYNNNLFTDILLAPHIFLSYSNLGYFIIRYPVSYF